MILTNWIIQRTKNSKRPYLTGVCGERYAHTTPIVEVMSDTTVRTQSGSVYELVGPSYGLTVEWLRGYLEEKL
jgi:hypothetical protein